MKQYTIRNADVQILFDKAKEIYDEYIDKMKIITTLAVKNICNLAETMPFKVKLDLVITDIIDTWIWKITESPGPGEKTKYFGQRYWTFGAIERYLTNLKEGKSGKELYQKLRHEHVYEKKEIIKEIKIKPSDSKLVLSLLERAVACIIEEKEHSKLNKGKKGWHRYIGKETRVIDLCEDKELDNEDLVTKV